MSHRFSKMQMKTLWSKNFLWSSKRLNSTTGIITIKNNIKLKAYVVPKIKFNANVINIGREIVLNLSIIFIIFTLPASSSVETWALTI